MTLSIRKDFPLLAQKIDGVDITYLDSAATSLKPNATMEAEKNYGIYYTSNVHRGHNALAEEASYQYESARRRISQWIKADPDTVVMMPNASYAIATVAAGIQLQPEDVILCASNNHHSNLLSWMKRAKIAYVEGDSLGPLDPDQVLLSIKKHRPKLLAFTWVSNVNGVITPAAEICKIASEHGVISLIDATQAAPHLPINVSELYCDFLVFSGHKMLGPTGTGVLWGRRELMETLEPLVIGGGTVDHVTLSNYSLKQLPHRLEAGTPNISGVIGLGAAIEYLEKIGPEKISAHERELTMAIHEVFNSLQGVRVLTAATVTGGIALASIIPTNINIHPDVLCQILSDSFKIMTRSGFHCAHPLLEGQGFKQGSVRFSAYIYNTVEEIHAVGNALAEILVHPKPIK